MYLEIKSFTTHWDKLKQLAATDPDKQMSVQNGKRLALMLCPANNHYRMHFFKKMGRISYKISKWFLSATQGSPISPSLLQPEMFLQDPEGHETTPIKHNEEKQGIWCGKNWKKWLPSININQLDLHHFMWKLSLCRSTSCGGTLYFNDYDDEKLHMHPGKFQISWVSDI